MISHSEIVSRLTSWIGSDVAPWIDQILPIGNQRWSDAVEAQIPMAERNKRPNTKPPTDLNARVFGLLGHIAVNPAIAHNSRVLRRSYEFSKEDGYVNNESLVTKFVDDLCKLSQEQRERFIAYQESHLSKTRSVRSTSPFDRDVLHNSNNFSFLVGDRGIGKTFFLNYLLTRYSQTFDARRVIWVRLNLVEDFGVENDLLHWSYAQIAKIVLRYYDPKSTFFRADAKRIPIPAYNHLLKFAKELPIFPSSYDIAEKIIGLGQEYIRNITDDPISPELCPLEIGREIFSFAVKCGYAFIIVFDGLDRLELIQKAREKFNILTGHIGRLKNTDEKLTSTFLVVCRTETFSLFTNGNAYSFDTSEYYELGNVTVEDVLRKRLTVIASEASRGLATARERNEVFVHLSAFVNYLVQDQEIARMFAKNRRAAMHAVQYRYLDFLRDQHVPGGYQITESLMKMGYAYPPAPYVYYLPDEFAETYERHEPQKSMDNRLLPSVFSYPHVPHSRTSKTPPHREGMVLGIRILQIAVAYGRLNSEYKSHTLLSRDIADILCVLFGYERRLVLTQIEDFGEFEFLRTVGSNTPQPISAENYEVSLMPKGEKIVSEYLSEATYLALGIMRTPFQFSAFSRLGGKSGEQRFLIAATSDSRGGFERWISAKVVNAINTRRLIKYFRALHLEMFKSNLSKLQLPHLAVLAAQAEPIMFHNESQADSAVIEQLGRVFSSLEEVDVNQVDRIMEWTERAFEGWA